MSKSRAKKKQRQRARASGGDGRAGDGRASGGRASGGRASGGGRTGGNEASERAERRRTAPPPDRPAPRRASRLEIRDGVRRPDAIWAPFPLTEIGMGIGLVLFLIGFTGAPMLLVVGIGVLVVVVAELCLREHFAGFRSHSILLAMLPVTIVHLGLVVLADLAWRGPLALAVDLALAGALAWWLQQRFRVAQGRGRLPAI